MAAQNCFPLPTPAEEKKTKRWFDPNPKVRGTSKWGYNRLGGPWSVESLS